MTINEELLAALKKAREYVSAVHDQHETDETDADYLMVKSAIERAERAPAVERAATLTIGNEGYVIKRGTVISERTPAVEPIFQWRRTEPRVGYWVDGPLPTNSNWEFETRLIYTADAIREARNAALEEAAQVADKTLVGVHAGFHIAAAIRALKEG